MDVKVIQEIDRVLDYPHNISPKEVMERLARLEALFHKISHQVPDANLEEKASFLRLMTRSLDLYRMGMDIQMKALGLSPEKLKVMFEHAKHSHNPKDRIMLEEYEKIQREMHDIDINLAKANAVSSKLNAKARQMKIK